MTNRDVELLQLLADGGGNAPCADLTSRFGDDAELSDQLRSLQARGLIEVTEADERCHLTDQGRIYLRHHAHAEVTSTNG
jgi:coproporphyrinogen III oxidase-like Fe-S oxidoreductase